MPYITCMINGVPKPFSAMWRTIGITRSARGFLLHSAMSTTGRFGWMNPIAAPSTRLFTRGAHPRPGTEKKLLRATAGWDMSNRRMGHVQDWRIRSRGAQVAIIAIQQQHASRAGTLPAALRAPVFAHQTLAITQEERWSHR